MKVFKRISASVACMVLSCSAFAWGGFEHSIVAYIAQEHLTENTQRNLRYYLDQPLTEYAEWMDHVPTQNTDVYRPLIWHTHAFYLNEDGSLPTKPLVSTGEYGGVHTMVMMLDAVADHKNQPDSVVVLYLRCLVHLFGDLHCPGHFMSHEAPGGIMPGGDPKNHFQYRKCTYKGVSKSSHWLWDTALQNEKPGWTFEDWRLFLDTATPEQRAKESEGSFPDWLRECGRDVVQTYEWYEPGKDYDETWYSGKVAEYAHDHIRKAGYRLAKFLNEVFDYE